jgi:putative adenylate-forming enzyme
VGLSGLWHFGRAFVKARRERRGGKREDLLERQRRSFEKFRRHILPRAQFYRPFAAKPFEELPIVSKASMLENFAAMNTRGIALDDALAVALEAEKSRDFAPQIDGLTVGLSSGTSGRRGVFLVSPRERARWAGLLLGRMLGEESLSQIARPWANKLEIAFFLRANSSLYETLESRRLDFSFYDLTRPFAELAAKLALRRADILVAPATVLAALAEEQRGRRLGIRPRQVISVAEVLDEADRRKIEAAFELPVEQIYQATEGFLGTSCEKGKIHLHEEEILFEKEWLGEDEKYFHPILTDLCRETQLVVRYRLDDVLRLAENPCPCGRPTLAIEAVDGRADDIFEMTGQTGERISIFPDVLRRMMALAGEGIEDYRLEQRPDGVWAALRLEHGAEGEAAHDRVEQEWSRLLEGLGCAPSPLQFFPFFESSLDVKKRRIRRVF